MCCILWLYTNSISLALHSTEPKSSNPVNNYARHNDKPYAVPHCNTIERQNSFFPRTTVDWNRLENEVVHADSINIVRALVANTR